MTITMRVPQINDDVAVELTDQTYRSYVRDAARRKLPVETVLRELVLSLLGATTEVAASCARKEDDARTTR